MAETTKRDIIPGTPAAQDPEVKRLLDERKSVGDSDPVRVNQINEQLRQMGHDPDA